MSTNVTLAASLQIEAIAWAGITAAIANESIDYSVNLSSTAARARWLINAVDAKAAKSVNSIALRPTRVLNLANKCAASKLVSEMTPDELAKRTDESGNIKRDYQDDEILAAREALVLVGFPKLRLTDCLLSSSGRVSIIRKGDYVDAPDGFRGVLASIKAKKAVDAKAAKESAKVAKDAAKATNKLVAALVSVGYSFSEAALIASKKA
jgi:hypothetical protein